MQSLLMRLLLLTAALPIAVVSLEGQTATVSPAPAIAVSISLQKDKIPLGQSPWVLLSVENLTDREITVGEANPHVEGKQGELPMKPYARIVTESFQPRTPRLTRVVYVPWNIAPKGSSIHKYQLGYFFDLSQQGRYTVYMDVMDPSSHKWLRTNTAKFEMQSPIR